MPAEDNIYRQFEERRGDEQPQQPIHVQAFTPTVNVIPVATIQPQYVQYGAWRDGLFDLFTKGGWPSFWMSCCGLCWPCMIGKIASRIRVSPSLKLGKTPFIQWVVLMSIMGSIGFICWLGVVSANAQILTIHMGIMERCKQEHLIPDTMNSKSDFNRLCQPNAKEWEAIHAASVSHDTWNLFSWLISFTFVTAVFFLRLRLRSKYLIPASCDNNVQPGEGRRLTACGMVEDCAYACCCTCCTLAQMSRHTYANEDCSPLTDPGPAESMDPMFQGQSHVVTPMQDMGAAGNSMYGHGAAVPVATSVVPVSSNAGSAAGAVVVQGTPCNV